MLRSFVTRHIFLSFWLLAFLIGFAAITLMSVPYDINEVMGALDEAQLITTNGRRKGANHWASSAAATSGPRRLNLALRPSNVPCPISTTHKGANDSFGSSWSHASRSCRSDVSLGCFKPRQRHVASACLAADSQRPAQSANARPYSGAPAAPTTTSTLGRSDGWAPKTNDMITRADVMTGTRTSRLG